MKVAIIGSRGYPYVYSGFETLVKELSERLVQRGVSVRVYCHRGLFKDRPKMVNGIHLTYLPAIETKVLSQLSNSFLSFVHACFTDVDVILVVNTANGPFGLLTRLFRKKTAINLDGLEWKRPKWKGLGAKYFLFASKLATRWFDHLISDAEAMRSIYQDLFNKDSTVIAYGANLRYSNQPELIQKWDIQPNDYFLIVGRLIPDNNADIIIEGFLNSNVQKKLVIVGDVPYQDTYATNLKKLAETDDRLLFTGYVKDQQVLSELYHNCYCYIHGHEFGGTNPTMLKALAYGCAIIALDTTFNREMLGNGKHGAFFNKDKQHVQSLLEWTIENPSTISSFQETARTGITKKYDWDEVTSAYLRVFEHLST